MKIIDVITFRLLLIFLEISGKFREISGNVKFPENLQPSAIRRRQSANVDESSNSRLCVGFGGGMRGAVLRAFYSFCTESR